MAKPNPKCPKCHGTGWALKSGTQTKAPCRECTDYPTKAVLPIYPYEAVVDKEDVATTETLW